MDCVLLETFYGNELSKQMTLKEAIDRIQIDGLLNSGELAERAISKKSGIALCNPMTPNIDTVSGKQIKYATVGKGVNSKYYKAYISRNTTAPILCVITNPILGEQYFLHIPYSAHYHLSGSCLAISFGTSGKPGASWLWHYEVDSFDELCNLAK